MEDFHEFDNNLNYRVTPSLEKVNPEFIECRVLSLALYKRAFQSHTEKGACVSISDLCTYACVSEGGCSSISVAGRKEQSKSQE